MKKATKKNSKKEIKKVNGPKIDTAHKTGIQPLGDRVLVREIVSEGKETKTASGIIIPVTESADKGSKKGEVIAVGPGRYEDGKIIPVPVKVGDRVLFQWGDKLILDETDVAHGVNGDVADQYLVRESEILAVIK